MPHRKAKSGLQSRYTTAPSKQFAVDEEKSLLNQKYVESQETRNSSPEDRQKIIDLSTESLAVKELQDAKAQVAKVETEEADSPGNQMLAQATAKGKSYIGTISYENEIQRILVNFVEQEDFWFVQR